jgi:hypothetical protein
MRLWAHVQGLLRPPALNDRRDRHDASFPFAG